MLRFRLFGIPHEIQPAFWITSALLSGRLSAQGSVDVSLLLVWVACVFVSIVAHELGHALAAERYGLQPRVSLIAFGGLTSFPGGMLTRWQNILVVLAGPAAGFATLIAVKALRYFMGEFGADELLYSPTQSGLLVQQAFKDLIYINLYWTLLNLLPILPLDGGQVLRDVLGPRLLWLSRAVGFTCAVAGGIWALMNRQPFLVMYAALFAYTNLMGGSRSLPDGTGR